MCKFESSQKDANRPQSADSSKTVVFNLEVTPPWRSFAPFPGSREFLIKMFTNYSVLYISYVEALLAV